MTDLAKIRKEIDDVDSKLLEYFEYRMDLAHKVAQYKKNGLPVFDLTGRKKSLIVSKTY